MRLGIHADSSGGRRYLQDLSAFYNGLVRALQNGEPDTDFFARRYSDLIKTHANFIDTAMVMVRDANYKTGPSFETLLTAARNAGDTAAAPAVGHTDGNRPSNPVFSQPSAKKPHINWQVVGKATATSGRVALKGGWRLTAGTARLTARTLSAGYKVTEKRRGIFDNSIRFFLGSSFYLAGAVVKLTKDVLRFAFGHTSQLARFSAQKIGAGIQHNIKTDNEEREPQIASPEEAASPKQTPLPDLPPEIEAGIIAGIKEAASEARTGTAAVSNPLLSEIQPETPPGRIPDGANTTPFGASPVRDAGSDIARQERLCWLMHEPGLTLEHGNYGTSLIHADGQGHIHIHTGHPEFEVTGDGIIITPPGEKKKGWWTVKMGRAGKPAVGRTVDAPIVVTSSPAGIKAFSETGTDVCARGKPAINGNGAAHSPHDGPLRGPDGKFRRKAAPSTTAPV